MYDKKTCRIIDIKRKIKLTDMLHIYKLRYVYEDLNKHLEDIHLQDFIFNYSFSNINLKSSYKYIVNIRDKYKRKYLLKLVFFLDSVKPITRKKLV